MRLERQDEASTPPGRDAVAAPAAKASPSNSTRRLLRRLAGRRRWVLGVGLLGAVLGGALGYGVIGQRVYEASGTIQLGRAVPIANPASSPADENRDTVRFDEVIQRELDLLGQLAGKSGQAEGVEAFTAVDASAPTRLHVRLRADNPQTAEVLLKSLLAGYVASTDLTEDAKRADYYQTQQNTLLKLQSQAAQAGSLLATAKAAKIALDGQPAQAIDLDAAWSAAAASLSTAEQQAATATRWLEKLDGMDPPTTAEVTALDSEAAAWWGRQRALDQQLAATAWPPAPSAATRLRERAELEIKLRERAADTRVLPVGPDSLIFRGVRVSEARSAVGTAHQRRAAAQSAVDELTPLVTQRRQLEADAQRLSAAAAEARAQLAALDPGTGLRLVSTGFIPNAAEPTAAVAHDSRPTCALIGGGGGALLGIFAGTLFFLADKRVRRTADGALADSSLPLISAVPVVGAADEQPRNGWAGASAEVSSIQSVRAVLEAKMARGQISFGIAGVGPGSGTTSIAAGLAVSMAMSGSRVLLVDLAWLQKPAGTGTDDEATREGLGIDGVIEELGYLDDEDSEIIALGGDAEVGFGALLEGASLRRSVVQTRLPGLVILSAMGQAEVLRQRWAGRLSSRWLSKLLAVSRSGGYAATILDTGSATGSVEGMLGCAAADGTIVVVSQHQTQSEYDKAVSRLSMIGATPIGTILNRSGAPRRGDTPSRIKRAQATGGTTGSGIFAAAIEARSTGRGIDAPAGDAGSGMFTAPLPAFEETPPSTIGVGVDPVDEPPATALPTPPRKPPTAQPNALPADSAESAATTSQEPVPVPASTNPDDISDSPPLQIHVIDDVMDQIVDHAIRSARQARTGSGHVAPPKAAGGE